MNELSRFHILIVEDDEPCRFLLSSLLSASGAEVKVCGSATEALQEIQNSKPDVIIADLMMPEHDGCWLMKQVRRLKPREGGNIPAIALTAKTGDQVRARVLEAGFQLYLAKPVSDDIITAIKIVAPNPRNQTDQLVTVGS